MIAALVLAAGSGRRFGASSGVSTGHKLLQEIAGAPLVCQALAAVAAGNFHEILAVVDAQCPEVEAAISATGTPRATPTILRNPHASDGHTTSLRMGLSAVDEQCRAAMVFLADMPLLTPDVVSALRERWRQSDALTVPECGGHWRHPRVITRRFFSEFQQLKDDQRGSVVFDRHRKTVEVVHWEDANAFLDVDHAGDLEVVRRVLTERG